MTDTNRVVIVGGHGKIALLAAGKLKSAGYTVDSVIRNVGQSDAVRAVGGNPVVLDIESANIEQLASVFTGANAIVFSAGAGGGNPARTHAVDYEAATRAMAAADQAGVRRFIMVSYATASEDIHRLDSGDAFYPYARAKHDADAKLRESTLDYTILGPALLTTEPATGKLTRTEDAGSDWTDDRRVTSRENVAEVIAHVIKADASVRQTVNFYDGDTPIADVMGR
ncbi:NAD-dependent dehydratase [Falsochrobactrum shanghaiense]|uniref:NAD-dependent dehydratase n=1 Tax=Falsochrobactrum shanghaiense TaxID=2201899 RepID=A0A316J6V5_9HYPH|nr:NAD(P)H-binding protein [Falsochrobactrum shanghaiense]PWL16499.1 NAD-dependent dehydratase [Falsochrobactrum shanghaiense]